MPLELFKDIHGNIQGTGLLAPDINRLKAFAASPNAVQEFTDAQIRELITDPDRVPMRKLFGPEWISNQSSYNSCAGWATVACQDRRRWLSGIRDKLMLSGSYVYAWCNNGQDNGSFTSDTLNEIKLHGAPSKQLVPENIIYLSQMPLGAHEAADDHKALIAYPVKSMQGLKTALALMMPCVVAIQYGNPFQQLNSKGVAGYSNGPGNHAIAAQDIVIIDGELVFDTANSHGLSYGDNGCAYLREESFIQTMPNHTFWAFGSPAESGEYEN